MIAAARRPTAAHIAGAVFLSLWVALGAAALWSLATGYETYAPYLPKYWKGLKTTLALVGAALVIGGVLSFPIALARLSGSRALRAVAFCYVYFFRGTPLIAQTFLAYYGGGAFREELEAARLWWIFQDAFGCALFVFSLNTAAYQAEILRGGILNVAAGQSEAGMALGLSRPVIFFRILLPQALITSLRPYGNEIILLLKGSAIASLVTVFDLMGETRRAFSRTFDYNTYLLAACAYLALVEVIRRVWRRAEERLTRHLRR